MNRTLLAKIGICIVISSSLLAGNFQFYSVKGSTDVAGVISSNTIWRKADSPYVLTGNVLIDNGTTLTIQPDVSVNLNGFYIMVNGTLSAKGTSTERIRLHGGEVTLTQFSSDWNESTGTGCIIENAVITVDSLSSLSSIKLSSNTINSPISIEGSSIVTNNVITQQVTITGFSLLTNNNIDADVSIGGSTVASNNTIKGTVRADGSSVIANNTITNTDSTTDAGLTCLGYVSAYYNVISGWGSGLRTESLFFANGGLPMVQNNVIFNNTVGIESYVLRRGWVGTNIPTIQNNLIYNNTKGVRLSINLQESYGENPPTKIQNNTIFQNGIGLELTGSVLYYCTIRYNNIQDNSNYSIYLGTSTDCNATNNWWGTTNIQTINQTIYDFKNDFTLGIVNFIPFLTEQNQVATEVPPEPTSTPTPFQSPTPTPTLSQTPSPSLLDSPTPSPSSTPQPTPTTKPDEGIYLPIYLAYTIAVAFVVLIVIIFVLIIKRRKETNSYS